MTKILQNLHKFSLIRNENSITNRNPQTSHHEKVNLICKLKKAPQFFQENFPLNFPLGFEKIELILALNEIFFCCYLCGWRYVRAFRITQFDLFPSPLLFQVSLLKKFNPQSSSKSYDIKSPLSDVRNTWSTHISHQSTEK